MAIMYIIAILAFDTVLGIIEIPKMLKNKLTRELVTFSILLVLGTTLAVLKSLNVQIPNPSDAIKWAYSPVSGVIDWLLK